MSTHGLPLIANTFEVFFRNVVKPCLDPGGILLTDPANEERCVGMRFHRKKRGTIRIYGVIHAEFVTVDHNGLGELNGITCKHQVRPTASQLWPVRQQTHVRITDLQNTIIE